MSETKLTDEEIEGQMKSDADAIAIRFVLDDEGREECSDFIRLMVKRYLSEAQRRAMIAEESGIEAQRERDEARSEAEESGRREDAATTKWHTAEMGCRGCGRCRIGCSTRLCLGSIPFAGVALLGLHGLRGAR